MSELTPTLKALSLRAPKWSQRLAASFTIERLAQKNQQPSSEATNLNPIAAVSFLWRETE